MAKLEITRGTVNTHQSSTRPSRNERRSGGEVVGHQSSNTPKLGAGPKLPEGVRSPSILGDPRHRDGSQASSPGFFGIRLDGDTDSTPAADTIRTVTQDAYPEADLATRLQQLRAQRRAIEVELHAVPIDNEHLGERRQLCNRRHEFCEQIEALETLGDGGPRLTVLLDDYASALVRRQLASEQDAIADDVVCAALSFMLGEEDDHFPEEEIAKATERRVGANVREVAA